MIENDYRVFGLADVLRLHERIGRPVVWDLLHHHCHDPAGVPEREALERALAPWPPGVTPKVHFSSPKTAVQERRRRVGRRVERTVVLPQPRAHADTGDPIAFERFIGDTAAGLDFDVMLEAKAKDWRCCACASSSPRRIDALPPSRPSPTLVGCAHDGERDAEHDQPRSRIDPQVARQRHQPSVPAGPLNGPTRSSVIQPP